LAKLALTATDYLEEILGQFNGFFLGVCLEDGEAADYLLRLGEGPSVTVCWPLEKRTRAPSALGRQPSVPSNHPDFVPSSISFPILAISSCEGGTPRSAAL
jgi:hypothetical protein